MIQQSRIRHLINSLLASMLICVTAGNVFAADSAEDLAASLTITRLAPTKAGLGNHLVLDVSGSRDALNRATADRKNIALVFDGVVLRGLCSEVLLSDSVRSQSADGSAVREGTNATVRLRFDLRRTETNKVAWIALLGSPRSKTRVVPVNIGIERDDAIVVLGRTPNSMRLVLLPDEAFFVKGMTGRSFTFGILVACIVALAYRGFKERKLGCLLTGWAWLMWALILACTYLVSGPTMCWVGFAILFLAGFVYLAKYTEMIRDSGVQSPAGKLRPYSLARTQMAIWFFLSISAFVFIWLMTNSLDTIPGTVLALMGISAGTALGAETQNSGKLNKLKEEKLKLENTEPEARTSEEGKRYLALEQLVLDVPCLSKEKSDLEKQMRLSQARLSELAVQLGPLENDVRTLRSKTTRTSDEDEKLAIAETQIEQIKTKVESDALKRTMASERIERIDELLASRPVSESFFEDILTDSVGISFHRFQMFVWTLVLGVIFLTSVYYDLAMPEFSDTLLALMGVSSGTYLGFMIPEQHSSQMS